MAKKAKSAAAKPATDKPAKSKPGAAQTMKTPTKPVKAVAKPVKKAAKSSSKVATPPAAKKLAAPAAALPLGNAPPAAPPSLSDRYASFEDAKNATVDTLLASIEAAETRLLEVKRAASFAQLEPLANGAAEPHS